MSDKTEALISECAALGLSREQAARLADAYFAVADERAAAQIKRLAEGMLKSLSERIRVVKPVGVPTYPKGTKLVRDASGAIIRVIPPKDAA